jgi:hypothetical protein
LKTAPEIGLGRATPFTPVQAERLLEKFEELERNREEAAALTG